MQRLALGVSLAALLITSCGDDTVDMDASTDAGGPTDAGPPPECGNDTVERGEACDDGNTVGGDGCSADCTSDETCGNRTVELAEICDDGNSDNGDGCSAGCDSDESCGNDITDFGVGEVCDDGNSTPGDGCNETCTSNETCGNGTTDPGEECDDENTAPGDGCDATCMNESCITDGDCDDGNPCNGDETCETGVCAAGTPLAVGGACGAGPARQICLANACVASVCGDRFLDAGATPAEECDDGNTRSGDGCDGACTLESCSAVSDCDDGNTCTAGHDCVGATCVLGVAIPNGTTCDADGDPGTRDICLTGFCGASRCGDGYVDAAEACDDGNTTSGDGCEADCTIPIVPTTAFRVERLTVLDPHIYTQLGTACSDLTPTVNSLIVTLLGDYTLNAVGLFRPLDLRAASTPLEVYFGASCAAGSPRDLCMPNAAATRASTTARNTLPAAMSCLTADRTVLNPSYTGVINTPSGPCFVTSEQTFVIDLGGAPVTLQNARMAATYVGGASPSRLRNGVIVGFLSESDAMTTTFDPTVPLIGGDTVYSHLADGRAPGSACTTDSFFMVDDSDMLAGANGFWFYLNFEATLVGWVP